MEVEACEAIAAYGSRVVRRANDARRLRRPVGQRGVQKLPTDSTGLQTRLHRVRRQTPHALASQRRRRTHDLTVGFRDPAAVGVGVDEVPQAHSPGFGPGSGPSLRRRPVSRPGGDVELVEGVSGHLFDLWYVVERHRPDQHYRTIRADGFGGSAARRHLGADTPTKSGLW